MKIEKVIMFNSTRQTFSLLAWLGESHSIIGINTRPPSPPKKGNYDLVQRTINTWSATQVECEYNYNVTGLSEKSWCYFSMQKHDFSDNPIFKVLENSCPETKEFTFCYRVNCARKRNGEDKVPRWVKHLSK